jgi:hypothetical protein
VDAEENAGEADGSTLGFVHGQVQKRSSPLLQSKVP